MRRELIALATVVSAAAFVLIWHHHTGTTKTAAGSGWVGQLPADTASEIQGMPVLTSSSLVVAPADLALPAIATEPAKLRNACDSADQACIIRPVTVVAPIKRIAPPDLSRATTLKRVEQPHRVDVASTQAEKSRSFDLLDHLPTAATLGRPFTAAGSLVSGWIKRL